jgi:hypothetical protein
MLSNSALGFVLTICLQKRKNENNSEKLSASQFEFIMYYANYFLANLLTVKIFLFEKLTLVFVAIFWSNEEA